MYTHKVYCLQCTFRKLGGLDISEVVNVLCQGLAIHRKIQSGLYLNPHTVALCGRRLSISAEDVPVIQHDILVYCDILYL